MPKITKIEFTPNKTICNSSQTGKTGATAHMHTPSI